MSMGFTIESSNGDKSIGFSDAISNEYGVALYTNVLEFPSKLFSFAKWSLEVGVKVPLFLAMLCMKHGLLYTRILGEDDDNPSSPIRRGWKLAILTIDKTLLNKGMKLKWLKDGVKTVMGPILRVKYDERRQQKHGCCLYRLGSNPESNTTRMTVNSYGMLKWTTSPTQIEST
ncbi:Clavaminate synthase protein [Spatholobus suberectus]|nr:Clavaminate synthase protein [Spatholobus suberectus]